FIVYFSQPPSSTLFPYTTLFRSVDSCFQQGRIRIFLQLAYTRLELGQDTIHGVFVRHTAWGERSIPSYESVRVFGPKTLARRRTDRKSTRLNSSHLGISYAVFCL